MSLVEKISQDLRNAMKGRDEFRTSCLRMVKAAIKNEQVARGHELKDEEVQSILQSLIRKGRDAAKEFRAGNRESLAIKEEKEVEFFHEYLPKQMSPDEIESVLKEVIAQISAQGLKDLGKVMKAAMPRMAGKAQGKEVNEILGRLLK
ncbi:MAG: GatB/YqeY domain-containing protein [Deltaproteobacteria bacterium]|nr:GatB/YqeY domain-containing protein [Deltaproteobacteria bacterium]